MVDNWTLAEIKEIVANFVRLQAPPAVLSRSQSSVEEVKRVLPAPAPAAMQSSRVMSSHESQVVSPGGDISVVAAGNGNNNKAPSAQVLMG